MIRGICFDMDGVLTDTEPLGNLKLSEALARQGCRPTEDQARCLLGVNMQTTLAYLDEWFPGRIDPERFMADWCALMLEAIRADGLPVKPGAREALSALRGLGIRLALCTSNTVNVVNDYLAAAGWDRGTFDRVITGDAVERGKPAPDIYLAGAAGLGLEPAECLAVEDSLNGVKSARAAGMRSVMIPDTLPFGEAFAPYVDVVLPDLSALVTMTEKEIRS